MQAQFVRSRAPASRPARAHNVVSRRRPPCRTAPCHAPPRLLHIVTNMRLVVALMGAATVVAAVILAERRRRSRQCTVELWLKQLRSATPGDVVRLSLSGVATTKRDSQYACALVRRLRVTDAVVIAEPSADCAALCPVDFIVCLCADLVVADPAAGTALATRDRHSTALDEVAAHVWYDVTGKQSIPLPERLADLHAAGLA
eukprot:6088129-Prymnesium_polylepis.1